jgi:hypothetical protein
MAKTKEELSRYIQNRFNAMKVEKEYMIPIFDRVGEYVNLRHESQQGCSVKGSFATEKVWDTTAVWASELAASATVNAVYPNAKRSLIIRPRRFIKNSEPVRQYFKTLNKVFTSYLDNQETNLYNAITEIVDDLYKYATSSMLLNIDEDADFFSELPITYRSMPLKSLYIDEGKSGKIDTIYYVFEYTLQQIVNEYGIENISPKLRDKFKNQSKSGTMNLDEKISVIQAIEPSEYIYGNEESTKGKKKRRKYSSIHMEKETKHVLKESGFRDIPVIPVRLQKRSDEIWGRCPSINGLPSILLANIMTEAINMAVEKQLDPALVVIQNGVLGTDINTSAGAINVVTQTGSQTSNPVFPLYTVGDINMAVAFLERIRVDIQKHFYLDWLFDMSAQRERTLGEVNLQNDLRGRAVGALYARIETELILPLLKKTFDVLFHSGQLGVFNGDAKHKALLAAGVSKEAIIIIPEDLKLVKSNVKIDKDSELFPTNFYDIVFISPAARARNREEVESMSEFLQITGPTFQIQPEAMDALDMSSYIKRVAELLGVDVELLNSDDIINAIKQQRAQQQQQQSQIQMAEIQSKIKRDEAMAGSMDAATISKLGIQGV